jgi:hypothetical protein
MKFNPITHALTTDAGELIKVLNCPRKTPPRVMPATDSPHLLCTSCEHIVLNTAVMTEAEVVAAVQEDPHTCLRVSSLQENLTVLRPPGKHLRRVD